MYWISWVQAKYRAVSGFSQRECRVLTERIQIIHNRVVRQLNTDYKVFAEEWDAESESVIVSGNCSNLLLGIQECLAWDVDRLEKVVRSLEAERRRFTADDAITMFHKLTKESSLFTKLMLNPFNTATTATPTATCKTLYCSDL